MQLESDFHKYVVLANLPYLSEIIEPVKMIDSGILCPVENEKVSTDVESCEMLAAPIQKQSLKSYLFGLLKSI